MDIITTILFVSGFVLLVAGAELLVRGASHLAGLARISPLVIGLTVVAYGTSAPELAVSIQSSLIGQADIAVGNVVGSNIANILLILGLSAILTPLVVSQQLVRQEVPLLIGLSCLFWWMGWDGQIGRLDGLILCAGAVLYTVFVIRQSRRESQEIQEEYAHEFGDGRNGNTWVQAGKYVGLVIIGLALLVLGADWLIDGAVGLARFFGVSELVIGLTIVAVGTSLPEVATSVVASLRGERDIAVGNAVGSNIFNILLVIGASGAVASNGLIVSTTALRFDMPVMIAVAVMCLPIFFTGGRIARWEGILFLGYYVIYILYLLLDAIQHPVLETFNAVLVSLIIPLTIMVLLVSIMQAFRARYGRHISASS